VAAPHRGYKRIARSGAIVKLEMTAEEAVRADLLIEDGDQMRFRHDLLREAARQSLPQSLRRAMERQSATVMLDMGAAPAGHSPARPQR
jgi:hypothetical protein